ncbi:hypothetical protein EG68_08193 [Paragonimus skrjabini miyazakii]|uniref:C2H2-type domain-containing protein n=1 Tax=Paragonimus skrjabini miyazakii TaxID=59628 RepID=A0A8S9YJS0_9TREM|nr:hypothetical protein EG68_08193 [Paragonimus skrjabini miyazakii]
MTEPIGPLDLRLSRSSINSGTIKQQMSINRKSRFKQHLDEKRLRIMTDSRSKSLRSPLIVNQTCVSPLDRKLSRHTDIFICPICQACSDKLESFVDHMALHVVQGSTDRDPSNFSDETAFEVHSTDRVNSFKEDVQSKSTRTSSTNSQFDEQETNFADQCRDQCTLVETNQHSEIIGCKSRTLTAMKNETLKSTQACTICETGLEFSSVSALQNHVQTVHIQKVYQCARCEKNFPTKSACTEHIFLDHIEQKLNVGSFDPGDHLHTLSYLIPLLQSIYEDGPNQLPQSIVQQEGESFDEYGTKVTFQIPIFTQSLLRMQSTKGRTDGLPSKFMQILKYITQPGNHQKVSTKKDMSNEVEMNSETMSCERSTPNKPNQQLQNPSEFPQNDKTCSKRFRIIQLEAKASLNETGNIARMDEKDEETKHNHSLLVRKKNMFQSIPTEQVLSAREEAQSQSFKDVTLPLSRRLDNFFKCVPSYNPWLLSHPVRNLLPVELASKVDSFEAARLCHFCLKGFPDEMAVLRHQVAEHSLTEELPQQ